MDSSTSSYPPSAFSSAGSTGDYSTELNSLDDIFAQFSTPSDSYASPPSDLGAGRGPGEGGEGGFGYELDMNTFLNQQGNLGNGGSPFASFNSGGFNPGQGYSQGQGQGQGQGGSAASVNSSAHSPYSNNNFGNSPPFSIDPTHSYHQPRLAPSPPTVSPPSSAQYQAVQQAGGMFATQMAPAGQVNQHLLAQQQRQHDFALRQQHQLELQARAQQLYDATLRQGSGNRLAYSQAHGQAPAQDMQAHANKKRRVSEVGTEQFAIAGFNAGLVQPQPQYAQRSAVDVISNAGIAVKPQQSAIYPTPAPPPPVAVQAAPSAATKATKAAEKKAAAAVAKKDKAAAAAATAAEAPAAPANAPVPAPAPGSGKKSDRGHNAVERRYRNNINNAIATLRDIIPALRHLKPLPSMPPSRRRASQFTLSTAAQAPTPAGLIDGIPAAKTLSKGVILSKAIEYISFLQGAREDVMEDVAMLKAVVMERVAQGDQLVAEFEKRRDVKEAEREIKRAKERKEQAILDGDESEDGEDEEEAEPDSNQTAPLATAPPPANQPKVQPPTQAQPQYSAQQHLDSLLQLRDQFAASAMSLPPDLAAQLDGLLSAQPGAHAFPPSPISSDELGISPRQMMSFPPDQQLQPQFHAHAAPPRMYLASFLGLAFTGGAGYDMAYGAEAAAKAGASAWASGLVRRASVPSASGAGAEAVGPVTFHPTLASGLVSLGLAAVVAAMVFLAYPAWFTRSSPTPGPVEAASQARSAYRARRRAEALASLSKLNEDVVGAPTYADECKAALSARRELLRLVGAPTFGLLPALAKEALATALRKVTTIRVGSFSRWPESDRIEAAVAWVRIAEIEASVAGTGQIHFLARAYTFLRLFNLSRSASWPTATTSVSRPAVDALLAVHLATLGQPLSASALWTKASKADVKRADLNLSSWVEVALGADFSQVRAILQARKHVGDAPQPSDTVPLLKVSEARCQAALREVWAKLFVAMVDVTAAAGRRDTVGAEIAFKSGRVDGAELTETLEHVLASTAAGPVQSLARATLAFVHFYSSQADAGRLLGRELAAEAREAGPITRLACSKALFALLLDDDALATEMCVADPVTDVDVLASATLGWLAVRRQADDWAAAAASALGGDAEGEDVAGAGVPKPNPALHAATLAVRRLLGHPVFGAADLAAACSTSGAARVGLVEPTELEAAGAGWEDDKGPRLDLEGAQDACVEGLTRVARRAAGLRAENDSGVELSD